MSPAAYSIDISQNDLQVVPDSHHQQLDLSANSGIHTWIPINNTQRSGSSRNGQTGTDLLSIVEKNEDYRVGNKHSIVAFRARNL